MRNFSSKGYTMSISISTAVMSLLGLFSILATYGSMILSEHAEGNYSNGESPYFIALACVVSTALISFKITKDLSNFHGENSIYYVETGSISKVTKWINIGGIIVAAVPQLITLITSDPTNYDYSVDIINAMGYGSFILIILLLVNLIYVTKTLKANKKACRIKQKKHMVRQVEEEVEQEEEYSEEHTITLDNLTEPKQVINSTEKNQYSNNKNVYANQKAKSINYSLSSTYSFYWLPLLPVVIMSWGLIMTLLSGVGIEDMYRHNYVRPISSIISLSIPCLMMIALGRKTRGYYTKKSAYYQTIGGLRKWAYTYCTKITFFVVLPVCFIIAPSDSTETLSMTECLILLISDLYLFAHAILIFRYFSVSKRVENALLEQNQKRRIKKQQTQKEELEE